MVRASQKLRVLKLSREGLLLLSMAFLVVIALYLLFNISEFQMTKSGSFPSGALSVVQYTAVLVVAALITLWGSDHLRGMANMEDKGLNDRLLGYVMASDESRFDVLAAWMRLDERETANRLAKLASRGELKDYVIDLPNRIVIRMIRQPVISSAQNPAQAMPARASATTVVGEPTDESYEVIQTKARLYELEQLKQSGKINRQAYQKVKEEYEKKLAQTDKGTQVY